MKHVRVPFGALSILLVLLLNLLAAVPALHECFHADADKADHHCAVTMFAHGQVDSPVLEVAAAIPAAPVEYLPLTSVVFFNVPVAILPPSCGPPAFFFNS